MPNAQQVLVVDDDLQVLRVISRALHPLVCITAQSASEATSISDETLQNVALIVCDVVLTSSTGPELTVALQKRAPHIQVLFMSGYRGDQLSRFGLPEGANFIEKPFDFKNLKTMVLNLLSTQAIGLCW